MFLLILFSRIVRHQRKGLSPNRAPIQNFQLDATGEGATAKPLSDCSVPDAVHGHLPQSRFAVKTAVIHYHSVRRLAVKISLVSCRSMLKRNVHLVGQIRHPCGEMRRMALIYAMHAVSDGRSTVFVVFGAGTSQRKKKKL